MTGGHDFTLRKDDEIGLGGFWFAMLQRAHKFERQSVEYVESAPGFQNSGNPTRLGRSYSFNVDKTLDAPQIQPHSLIFASR